MTNDEKDKLILKMYEKRLSYLKGEISEESYFKYVNNNTVDKLCTNKNGYKNLDSKLKATKNFIKKYFRSVPTLKNIDKYNELERLEKEFKNKKNKIDIVTLRLRKEDVYNKYIDYCKGIGKDLDDNEEKFINILNEFNYKSINPNSKITKRNALSTKFKFFRETACEYYCETNNKKRVDFFKYIDELEEKKKIKYLKKDRKEEDKITSLRELLYTNYIKYLNDQISERKLIDIAKSNDIDLFTNSDEGLLATSTILKVIEAQSHIYSNDVIGNSDIIRYLKNSGPLVKRLKAEGKIPLYNDDEIKIIKKIYDNFISYYDMNIDYDTYINKETKLVEEINEGASSYSYRRNSKYYINYYLNNVLHKNVSLNRIVNNSNLYKRCFIYFREYFYDKKEDNLKEFVDKYRVNIYNYAYTFAKENDLLDVFNDIDKIRKEVLSGNYNEIRTIDYKDLVNKYIDSNLFLDDFISNNDIDKKEFLNYIKYLKNSNDKLYVKYNASLMRNKTKKEKYLDNTINGLYSLVVNGIPSYSLNKNREFRLLDFYIYCDKFLYDEDRLIELSKSILKEDRFEDKYFNLLRRIKKNNNLINKDDLYNKKISYKGDFINKFDIDFIVEYFNKNNIPLTMKLFSEVLIRYLENNLLVLHDEVLKLKGVNYKSIEFIKNSDIISNVIYLPELGEEVKKNVFNINRTKYGYKVKGINNVPNNYKLINISNIDSKKLLNKIVKDYNIIVNLEDNDNSISLITKYTTINENNNYVCELCGHESDNSCDFEVSSFIDDNTFEIYNTYCLCHKCKKHFSSYSVNDKIRLIKNVRNRIESRLDKYLDSFDKYVLIDNFDKIAYSLENYEEIV